MSGKLSAEYAGKKKAIDERLEDFRGVWSGGDKRIFSELCFCICTPQSKAVHCDAAVSRLAETGALFKGTLPQVRAGLKGVRFPNNKARYILECRRLFTKDGRIRIKDKIDPRNVEAARRWLVRNVKGLGLKEASHFLRNIGLGSGLAILDVHIMRNMKRLGIIDEIPKCLTEKCYLAMEEKLRRFAGRVRIPMDALDLLFWSRETGMIFK